MNIIDTSAIDYVLQGKIALDRDDVFFVSEDIKDEIELSAQIHDTKVPVSIHLITENPEFSQVEFYINYKEMLNKHSGYSFSNMKGIGDISLLAVIRTLAAKQSKLAFLATEENIDIYTDDTGLIKRIKQEFSLYKNINIYRPVGNKFEKS